MDSQNSSTTTEEYLSPDEIKALPFAKKLYLLASADFTPFIIWDPTGTMIGIETCGLRQYLSSEQSIFFVKNCKEFVASLRTCGFEQVPVDDKIMNAEVFFKHASFLRDHKEQLINVGINKQSFPNETDKQFKPNILKRSAYLTKLFSDELEEKGKKPLTDMRPMEDKTFAFYGGISKSVHDHVCYKVQLKFTAAQRNLEEKKWEMEQAASSGTVVAFPKRQESSHPGLPGFYGHCSMEKLKECFGDLLEKYKTAATEDKNRSDNITEVLQKTESTQFVVIPPQEPKAAAKQHIDESFADKKIKQVIPQGVILPPQTSKLAYELDNKYFAEAKSSGEEDLPLGELKMKLTGRKKMKKFKDSKKNLLGSKKKKNMMNLNHDKNIKLDAINVMNLNVNKIENDDKSIKLEMDSDLEGNKEKVGIKLEQQKDEKPDPIQSFDDFLKEINDAWDDVEI